MKLADMKKYLGIFILAVAIIAVYKTFDNIGVIFDYIGNFFSVLAPFIFGGCLAFVLKTPCKKVERLLKKTKVNFIRKYRRPLSVFIIFILAIIIIGLIMIAIIPQLVESLRKFLFQLPGMVNSASTWINSLGFIKIEDIITSEELISGIKGIVNVDNVGNAAQGVISFGSSMVSICFGMIISIYFLIDRRKIGRVFYRFTRFCFPDKFRKGLRYYGKRVATFIEKYIICQVLDSCIVFVLCFIALSIMRSEYTAMMALMVGSFNLIPCFGAIVAVCICALITLVTDGFMSAVILTIVLIVLQQLDANLIQPRLVGSSLSINPLLVIFGVIIGGGLFGIFGMFICVPLVALAKNIASEVYEKNKNKITTSSSNTSGSE